MHEYDKSGKWLIQHYGDSILRLAGVDDIETWKALQAELVQSRRLPDGLIEVRRRGESELDLYLLEIVCVRNLIDVKLSPLEQVL
jgi:hypothetical protein